MLIALDFDGTLVENEEHFPDIGADNGARPWLEAAAALDVEFVLYTCRDNPWSHYPAAEWCELNLGDLPWIHARQDPGKQRAQLYIDDKALGAPLKTGSNGRPCIDWKVAGPLMMAAIAARRAASEERGRCVTCDPVLKGWCIRDD